MAFALIGIVTLQLGLLKLNGEIGRTLGQASVLQRENALLGIENSELAAGNRIETRATALGMELVPTGAVRFLSADPGSDPARALAALSSPVHSSTATVGEASGPSSQTSAESTTRTAGAGASASAPTTESSVSASPGTASGGQVAGTGTAETPARTSESPSATSAASGAPASAGVGASSGAGASTGEGAATGPGGGTQASPAG